MTTLTPDIFIGIDPGLTGYIAIQHVGHGIEWMSIPTVVQKSKRIINAPMLAQLLYPLTEYPVVIEQQMPMPGQGLGSTYTIGKNYGLIYGVCVGLGMQVTPVHPRVWQRKILPNVHGRIALKRASIQWVLDRYEGIDLYRTPRCKTPCNDKADAACIAEYCRQFYRGETE